MENPGGLVGRLSGGNIVRLWVAPNFIGNGFIPVFRGSIEATPEGGSVILGRFTPQRWTQAVELVLAAMVVAILVSPTGRENPAFTTMWVAAAVAMMIVPTWLTRLLRPRSISQPIEYLLERSEGRLQGGD
jgi:hypothetical protein